MALQAGQQFLRKISLWVYTPGQVGNNPSAYTPAGLLDLSDFHIQFQTQNDDAESPNSCSIRVYNLSEDTVKKVREEYSRVVLQAGYQNGPFGVIFDGTMMQFRTGKVDNKTTYLDILAADGDIAYNWAIVQKSLVRGTTVAQQANEIVKAMTETGGVTPGTIVFPSTGGVVEGMRGKVLFGYAKAALRQVTRSTGTTWSIQNGKVNVIPLDSFLPNAEVVLTAKTGLIGRPEQTQEGIKAQCLLNPEILVGGTVWIDNRSINQTAAAQGVALPGGAQLAFNQRTGFQNFASVTADGRYRVYVAEHEGDTRGNAWYTRIICLTVNPTTGKVQPYGY